MAIYHLHTKIIKRSAGRSSVAAAYRSGSKIIDDRTGLIHDYSNKKGVDKTAILAPENSPSWIHDRKILWNAVEKKERRKDAQTCREVEVSIPVELNQEQQLALVKKFVQTNFVKHGMVADIAFHKLTSKNPHAHILLTMRELSLDGFDNKNRNWNNKDWLKSWRESWQQHANQALYSSGSTSRIDHRSLKEQGINKQASQHLGPKRSAIIKKGGIIEGCFLEAIYLLQKELKKSQAEIRKLLVELKTPHRMRASPGAAPKKISRADIKLH